MADKHPVPFGRCVAHREYAWQPEKGRRRVVKVQIGTPVPVPGSDWGCRVRITGLPGKQDRTIFGIDGVQALELALSLVGVLVSGFARSEAGRFEASGGPVEDELDLGLPLPLTSIQRALQNLRRYLKRAKANPALSSDWRKGTLLQLAQASADLAALAGR